VILVDVNILLYAYNDDAPQHDAARAWWETQLSGTRLVRVAWVTVAAFLRIATQPRVFPVPMSIAQACDRVDRWWEQPVFGILEPTERHWTVFGGLVRSADAGGNLVTDAHLAALAIEHGATLASTDQDFRRFIGLTWMNPLAP
jgi:uncharacterized protein